MKKTVRVHDSGSHEYLDGILCRYSIHAGPKYPYSETLAYVFDRELAEKIVNFLNGDSEASRTTKSQEQILSGLHLEIESLKGEIESLKAEIRELWARDYE